MRTTRALIATLLMLVALALIPAISSAGPPDVPSPLAVGVELPKVDFKMKNIDGVELSLADLEGDKGTLIMFTCNHCPFVVAWEDRMAALGNAYMDKGFRVIAINSNDPSVVPGDNLEGMKTRAQKLGARYPYVVDEGSKLAQMFGASRTPEVFLFSADNALAYHGTIDDNAEDASAVKHHYLRDALDAVLAGEPVGTAQTKAPGCSIKWYE